MFQCIPLGMLMSSLGHFVPEVRPNRGDSLDLEINMEEYPKTRRGTKGSRLSSILDILTRDVHQ